MERECGGQGVGGRRLASMWPQGGGSCPLSGSTKEKVSIFTACNVWHFLRGEKHEPLFILAAVWLAQQAPNIEMSAAL